MLLFFVCLPGYLRYWLLIGLLDCWRRSGCSLAHQRRGKSKTIPITPIMSSLSETSQIRVTDLSSIFSSSSSSSSMRSGLSKPYLGHLGVDSHLASVGLTGLIWPLAQVAANERTDLGIGADHEAARWIGFNYDRAVSARKRPPCDLLTEHSRVRLR